MRKYFSISILLLIITLLFAFGFPPIGSWYQQGFPSIGDKTINDITFLDSLNGFAIASRNVNPDTSVILKTTNGGDSWSVVFNQSPKRFSRVIFLNSNTGFVSGGIGTGIPNLYKTTDSGNNWFLINSDLGNLYWDNMAVLNTDTIWLVDKNILNGGVYRTTNGGVNWTQQLNLMSQNPTKIYMFNARIGFITNGGNFKKTTNGGTNWIDVLGETGFRDIKFLDSLTGWKCSSTGTQLKKTTDGGDNWILQDFTSKSSNIFFSRIYQISIINKDTVWGFGRSEYQYPNLQIRGMIHITTNSGANWGVQIPDTSFGITSYSAGMFINKNYGWALSGLRMIHTTNGGDSIKFITNINSSSSQILDFKLYQNYPNPFNPSTTINYELRNTNYVTLKVYDLQGKEVQTLVNKKQSAGNYSVEFNGSNLSSGIYFYTLQTGNFKETKRMMLIK
jgi:photosystem II stability/assembly factor-like uncharacterized protein